MKQKLVIFFYFFVTILSATNQVPTKGLVLHLPLDGNVSDLSGFANNGTNYGATTTTNRFGVVGKAMLFDGSSYLVIPSTPNLILANNKTLSCWVYIPSSTTQNDYPTIIHKDEPLMSTTYSIMMCEISGYASLRYKFDFLFASNYNHYQVYTKQLYTNYKDKWIHIASTYDSISGYSKMYFNGIISDSLYTGNRPAHASSMNLYVGTGKAAQHPQMFKGSIDDIRLYNRALSKSEIYQLYMEGQCTSSIKNDTTTYYVSSENFKLLSPRQQFIKTDSLKTKVGSCDSIINHYAKFEYSSKICTITNSIAVTDTLFINVTINTVPLTNTLNTIKIFPNPAKDQININFGDYIKLPGYLMTIRNELGSVMYFSPIIQETTTLDIKNWGIGVYVIQLFDNQSNIIETRKIIIR